MINRILIRIKVIQILYSFLLVEKKFALESMPSAPTKEKRFAYALYLDMIVLMIKIARSVKLRSQTPLVDSRFISRLLIDDTVKSALAKANADYPFDAAVESLAASVKDSGIYKNWLKTRNEPEKQDPDLWKNIFDLIIMNSPQVKDIIADRQGYTLKGRERMCDMMNRTFVNFLTAQDNIREVENALEKSLDESRDLYLRFLCMPVEITDLQDRILDENRHKFLKTDEDINPNMRFVENGLVEALRRTPQLEAYLEGERENGRGASWAVEDPVLFRKLLGAVLDSDDYKEYMTAGMTDLKDDCELWRNLFKKVILENSVLLQALEDKSVFWNDDIDIISTFVLKSFRRVADGLSPVLDKFKDEEDAVFGRELIRYVYRDRDTYRRYIKDALDEGRWDTERLAFMDVVIMVTALAEIMNFPKIPLQASLNEYIELAKSYSSERSGIFVNGVLGAVIERLRKEGKLLGK